MAEVIDLRSIVLACGGKAVERAPAVGEGEVALPTERSRRTQSHVVPRVTLHRRSRSDGAPPVGRLKGAGAEGPGGTTEGPVAEAI